MKNYKKIAIGHIRDCENKFMLDITLLKNSIKKELLKVNKNLEVKMSKDYSSYNIFSFGVLVKISLKKESLPSVSLLEIHFDLSNSASAVLPWLSSKDGKSSSTEFFSLKNNKDFILKILDRTQTATKNSKNVIK